MRLFQRYIKSATYNTFISEKAERVLMLVFFPVWMISLIPTVIYVTQGCSSIPLYFKSLELKDKYQYVLTKNRRNKENQENIKRIIEQSGNQKRSAVFNTIDSINKGVKDTKPTVSEAYQKSELNSALSESISFDLKSFREVGIDNPNPYDDDMPNEAIAINLSKMTSSLFSLLFYILIFIIPWLCIRTFFWIKTASTTSQSS